MLAHSTESSVGGEVNKHSLIRLHKRPSHHLSDLVMPNNSTHTPTGILSCIWVNGIATDANKLQVTSHVTKYKQSKVFKRFEILNHVTFIDLVSICYNFVLYMFLRCMSSLPLHCC